MSTLVTAPIIVVVDGSRTSSAALGVATALAERDGAPIEAVHLEGIGRRGDRTIAELARTSGASLVVVGLRRRRVVRFSLGGGAAGRVVQSATVPVLAVAATARGLPHTAVAATDFSPTSLAAARAARDLLAAPGTLYLVHVQPAAAKDSFTSVESESWNAVYDEGAALQLERLASELELGGIKVIPRLAKGPLVETLIKVISDVGADLIACGTDNLNAFERLLVGYPPLELLRRADCSVLIAPYAGG